MKGNKNQPPRRSEAAVLKEKLSASEQRCTNLEGYVDTYKAEIDQITVELESIRALLAAKDRRILSLGGLVTGNN